MRVLFVSNPMMGHTLPLVPLATAMRDAGHDVVWATGTDAHATVAGAGATPIRAGRTHAEWISEFTDRYPEVKDIPSATRGDFMFPRFFGELIAPVMLDDVCTIVDRWQPDLLVHDSAELSTPIVAAACSIPKATQSVGAPPPLTRIEAASNAVEPLWRDLDLTPPPWAGTFDPVHLDIYPPSMRPLHAATLPPGLPLRPASHASSNGNHAAPELPLGDAPLVYVTFGTVFNTARATLSSVIEAVAALDVRVLVTIGSTVNPATFGDQPRNVRVERFIPQDAVLRFASVVVSHAGSGTTLGALRHGVPQLCLPQGADQFVNGEQVQLADAGLTLKPNDANQHEVARAVQRLLAEPTFAAGASRIREEIDSMPSPADVVADLERFVAR